MGLNVASILRGIKHGPKRVASIAMYSAWAAKNWKPTLPADSYIPTVPLDELMKGSRVDVTITSGATTDGALEYRQALDLLSLAAYHNPDVVLEIGTFMGSTTRDFARTLPSATIHTVDLPPDYAGEATELVDGAGLKKDDFHLIEGRKVGRDYLDTPYAARIHQHFGDTAKMDFGVAAGATFFFIDGAHTYDYCRNDSEKCFELCGGKGVFLWHDCDESHPGVVQFLLEWRALGRDVVRIASSPIAYWNGL